MHQLPKYDPPQFNPAMEGNLNDRVKSFFTFWGNLQQYLYNYLNNFRMVLQQQGSVLAPYTPITAAATISPTRHVQTVVGSATISNISVASDFDEVTLLAQTGFTLATGGNIAASATVNPGQAVTLVKDLGTNTWYVG